MKLLRDPEPCLVLLDPTAAPHGPGSPGSLLEHPGRSATRHVTTLRWRSRVWTVHTTLEIWTYRGAWWLDAQLEGEAREYHVLGTRFGEIEIFARFEAGSLQGWFVSRYWD